MSGGLGALAPAQSGLSFHDGVDVRLCGGIRRAGERSSWGGGEGGDGAACVAGEADGFEVGHFGCGVCGGARDCSFEESEASDRIGATIEKSTIRLENNPGAGDGDIVRFWRNSNICSH